MGAFFGVQPKKKSLAALEAEEFGTRRVLDELAFSLTFLDSLVTVGRACLVDTGGLCPS